VSWAGGLHEQQPYDRQPAASRARAAHMISAAGAGLSARRRGGERKGRKGERRASRAAVGSGCVPPAPPSQFSTAADGAPSMAGSAWALSLERREEKKEKKRGRRGVKGIGQSAHDDGVELFCDADSARSGDAALPNTA